MDWNTNGTDRMSESNSAMTRLPLGG